MAVLYLVEQGSTVRKDRQTFSITKDGAVLQKVPINKVDQVVLFGNIGLTTPVIIYLLEQGIDCVFCSSTGKYHGRLFSTESNFGLLRQAQFKACADTVLRLSMASCFVRAKISNQRTMLMRYARERQDAALDDAARSLQASLDQLQLAGDVASVQGIEGYAAATYYAAFKLLLKHPLDFQGRRRRPPPDPVNSLLSLGYTLLVYGIQGAIRTVGLDPFLGFLHSTQYSKPSLALDMMEEFRPLIVDSIVLRAINSRILSEQDFERAPDREGMMRLKQGGLKTYLGLYEERVQTEISDPLTRTKVTYRRLFDLQARQMARVMTGKQNEYNPFMVK